LHLPAVKRVSQSKTDKDSLALTNCQKSKLELRQIKTAFLLPTVKRVSWSQGR
jgi:hypothetical protein